MKKYILLLLTIISFTAYSQTSSTLPSGAKPYGNQLYILPSTGDIWGGNAGYKYRVVAKKSYVDSLTVFGYKKTQVDSLLALKANLAYVNNEITNIVNYVNTGLALKVDKVSGLGLSQESYTTVEKSKLSGVQIGATQNQTDAYLLSRANHTGSQSLSTINVTSGTIAGRTTTGAGSAENLTPFGLTLSSGNIYNGVERYTNNTPQKIVLVKNIVDGLYRTGNATDVGAIKIALPTGAFISGMQPIIKGVIYFFDGASATNRSCEFIITANTGAFGNGVSAVFIGSNAPNFPVRWYTDADGITRYIAIGELNQDWSYLSFAITDVVNGLNGATLASTSSGYNISLITAFTGSLSYIKRDNLPKPSLSSLISDYNADSGVDVELNSSNSIIQSFQNLQKQIKMKSPSLNPYLLGVVYVGDGVAVPYGSVSINSVVTGAKTDGYHGFEDHSAVNMTGNVGGSGGSAYASIDAKPTVIGSLPYEHVVGLQSRPNIISSASITNRYEGLNIQLNHNSSGSIANVRHIHIEDVNGTGSGAITNNTGLKIDNILKGTNRFAIVTGSGKVSFGDDLEVNGKATVSTAPTNATDVIRLSDMSIVNTTTTALSSATLNSTYPNVIVGFRVICHLITGAPAIYTKATENGSSDVWLTTTAIVTP